MTPSNALAGERIVVTRAADQAEPLACLIRQRGGIPLLYPSIRIAPPEDPTPLDAHLRRLRDFDWLALTSSNAVRALQERCSLLQVQPAWSRPFIAVVGAQTNAALRAWLERDADFEPDHASAGALAQTLPLSAGASVLLPQSDRANPSTAEILRARSVLTSTVVAYRTLAGNGGVDLGSLISHDAVDALTFASPSAITFFLRRCSHPKVFDLPAACIGPATAAAAREAGFVAVVAPPVASLAQMLDALAEKLAER